MSLATQEQKSKAHPYIDDTAGAALPAVATRHYEGLLAIMDSLGLDAAPHKSQPPCFVLIWIGVLFDTLRMLMAFDPDKIVEALILCQQFIDASWVSLHDLQVFVGKLCHVTKCSTPARRFTSRVLDLLRAAQRHSPVPISHGAKLDVAWFLSFLPMFNGITLMKAETAQMVAQVDACPAEAGGICAGLKYYAITFPEAITVCEFSIASLECFNILLACRIWMQYWRGLHVLLYSDNWASVCALNSGAALGPLDQGVHQRDLAVVGHPRCGACCPTQTRDRHAHCGWNRPC